MILLECTPQLDIEYIEDLSGNTIKFHKLISRPQHVGIPANGGRLWATACQGKLSYPSSPYTPELFQQFAQRRVVCGPDIFCQSTLVQQQEHKQYVNQNGAKLMPHARGKEFRCEDLLGTGTSFRLHLHRNASAHYRRKKPSLFEKPFFWDLQQNPFHHMRPNGTLPRPVTNSFMWSEQLSRPLVPIEVLASQGKCKV